MKLVLPPPPGTRETAVWTGSAFRVGEVTQRILTYHPQPAGWSDDLTELYLDDNGGEDHYINVASRRSALDCLGRWIGQPDACITDIGCASGYALEALRQRFPQATVIGVDPFTDVLKRVGERLPDVPLIQFDLTRCPLPDSFVDGAVLLNVLEHIEDDEAALRQVFRILRPNGIAYLEVPSGDDLFDVYDRELRHFRRYGMRDLSTKVKRVGFEILDRSHLGVFAFPAFWLVKKINRRHRQLTPTEQRAVVLRSIRLTRNLPLMRRVMEFEHWLGNYVYFPFGIRCILACRRPSKDS
jgi:SAM-dependent methyltransferase